ncbi:MULTISPECIES: FtsX-like permease family protein [unclassified Rhizobacter]|uniref:FtsX-like permease family protein n=1 Tax=unclassified Rhizobacter TaxID=2640088 RepID=UPI0006FAA5DC|nr:MULTISPECIES: ABC transporter permease [unclassified Rhizobacter]KQU73860.1 ABC transporter permease [Rhizobacter sp. Root29]KQW11290.1 ABC transporter permease [Rhizobacter sp. Root1238]KRB18235.1 ABC transporter permease [Rhizobacter sp. Root16D2]
MLSLLRHLSWPELRHHPWRNLAALLAVMLGVALAFSVQLINQSALGEFSSAVRAVNGEPDFELRSQRGGFDEGLYGRVAAQPQVAIASPIVELDTYAFDAQGQRVPLHVVGVDALVAGPLSPALMPRPAAPASAAGDAAEDHDRFAVLAADSIFLNAQAQLQLGHPRRVRLQTTAGSVELQVRGSIGANGPALAVMDIAGAQSTFGWSGRLSRIDVRLAPGADRAAVLRALALPEGVRAASPDEAAQRVSNVSRAYRVNLTVLALVALFTGAFLVFSILSLSVAKRQPQLALLGVLGLGGRERLQLVLAESALLGLVGSLLGLALGTGLAALALRLLAGDLGGGYFPGVAPQLQFSALAAVAYGGLGVAAALVGGWLPARAAQQLAPALALKGLGTQQGRAARWPGPVLLVAGVGLALLPPVAEIPLAAYLSVACLLLGGIACVPVGVAALLSLLKPSARPLALLAIERARHQRNTATIAVAGVVASLSLAVALTVMVASFRDAVTQWLDTVLPADLYLRAATNAGGNDVVTLPPQLLQRAAVIGGVLRVESQRVSVVQLDPQRPGVVLIARPLSQPGKELPLVGELLALPAGERAAYVSEAMVSLYGAAPGTRIDLPQPNGQRARLFVRGVWRDYARQHGAVTLTSADYQQLTGDTQVNDMALWLAPGADAGAVQAALRAAAQASGLDGRLLEFASPGEIRALSLRIFDRSFAVTYWLQAVAIAIGLFGIAASFSAQVLARRKEFGLLAHLGLTRRQVLAVVSIEGAVWTAAGALLGLMLGLAVSVVLVKVVNPQSFHWTMDLLLPWGRLAALCTAVIVAGTLTAWLSARSAAGRQMALAVKEDW